MEQMYAPASAGELGAHLSAVVAEHRIPAAVVTLRSPVYGHGVWCLGETEIDNRIVPTLDHHFRVGSLTKTMTAAVILQLIDDGRLSFDDALSAFVWGVPGGDGIKIGDLLQMRSGLSSMDESAGFLGRLDTEVDRVWTESEIHRLSFTDPPHSGPRQGFHYSNINYYLLGEIMEQLTGQTATRLFHDRLFEPLGMTESSLPMRDDAAAPQPLVHGYQIGASESIGDPLASLTEAERADFEIGAYRPRDRTFDNPGWGWTAGSAISTPRDLQIWATELVIGSLLSDAMQQRRLDEIPDPGNEDFGPGGGYGNGLARRDGIYWHNGQLPGYSTYVGNDLATGTTVTVNTNLTSTPSGSLPADTIGLAIWDWLGSSQRPDEPG